MKTENMDWETAVKNQVQELENEVQELRSENKELQRIIDSALELAGDLERILKN